jgi:8-oxo-dGTP diphosphatase
MYSKPFSLSVKVLISDPDGRWLFLKRINGGQWNPGRWDLPGGKVDLGERFEVALLREVQEETGLDIVITGLMGAVQDATEDFRIVHIIMKGTTRETEIQISHEHEKYIWINPIDLDKIELCEYLNEFLNTDANHEVEHLT